jgi:hypothetical protein
MHLDCVQNRPKNVPETLVFSGFGPVAAGHSAFLRRLPGGLSAFSAGPQAYFFPFGNSAFFVGLRVDSLTPFVHLRGSIFEFRNSDPFVTAGRHLSPLATSRPGSATLPGGAKNRRNLCVFHLQDLP